MVNARGDKFTGYLVDGQPSGRGKIVYADGDIYDGEILNGIP
jgi:hypothetical protein